MLGIPNPFDIPEEEREERGRGEDCQVTLCICYIHTLSHTDTARQGEIGRLHDALKDEESEFKSK